MLRLSEITGFPILCLDTHKIEGEVKDAVLNLQNNKIEGLIVDCGKLVHRAKFLKYSNIYSVGRDIVTTKLKNYLASEKIISNCSYLSKSNFLLKREVITEQGNILGFVQDILFEKADGRILGVVLTNGVIDDIISGIQIIPMDPDFKYIRDKLIITDKIKVAMTNNIGGLKKLLELE